MINLLHAECCKLKKSRSFLGCAIAILCLVIMVFVMLMVAQKIQSGEMENGTAGVIVSMNDQPIEEVGGGIFEDIGMLDIQQQMFSGDFMALIIAVFCSIFIVSEYGCGTFKNIVGKGYSRSSIYLSRLITAIAAVILLILFGMVIILLCGAIFIGPEGFAGTFWKDLAVYMGLQIVIGSALTTVFVLIGEVCRNLGGSISLGIAVAVFSSLLTGVLDMVFTHTDFTPSEYWLMDMSTRCPVTGFETDFVIKTILISAVWLTVAAAVGMWHFHRADIK